MRNKQKISIRREHMKNNPAIYCVFDITNEHCRDLSEWEVVAKVYIAAKLRPTVKIFTAL